jgi:FlaG/FlaF family flagellin (archaellin)
MVDAITAIGIVGMVAVVLMIIGTLYLTVLGVQSDRDEPDVEPKAENG